MKILMFGWEFPPHISGGLGTACKGLTHALTEEKIELTFVVPKLFGEEDQRLFEIVGASDVPIVLRDSNNNMLERHSAKGGYRNARNVIVSDESRSTQLCGIQCAAIEKRYKILTSIIFRNIHCS